nr:unnamed protein product [Callosobruchus chinensis]
MAGFFFYQTLKVTTKKLFVYSKRKKCLTG